MLILSTVMSLQDAAAKLYLGALLAAQPAVAEGIVTSANGGAWFDVYVPRYGHEARLQTADMPCSSTWKASTKWVFELPVHCCCCDLQTCSSPSTWHLRVLCCREWMP